MPLWTDAYLADTTDLSAEEHGVYLLLLMAAWRSPDCALPDDDERLARMARVGTKKWRKIRPVMERFFTVSDQRWTQNRLLKERDRIETSRDQKREAAKAKWRKNNDSDDAAASEPDAPPQTLTRETRARNPDPDPGISNYAPNGAHPPCGVNGHSKGGYPRAINLPSNDSGRRVYPDAFEMFWQAWPQNPNDTKKAAYEAWRKAANRKDVEVSDLQAGAEKHAAHVATWPADKRVHVQTWINREGWTAPYDEQQPEIDWSQFNADRRATG